MVRVFIFAEKKKSKALSKAQHYADKADFRVTNPLAVEIISVLCTKGNIDLKRATSLQCTQRETVGRMCQPYLP